MDKSYFLTIKGSCPKRIPLRFTRTVVRRPASFCGPAHKIFLTYPPYNISFPINKTCSQSATPISHKLFHIKKSVRYSTAAFFVRRHCFAFYYTQPFYKLQYAEHLYSCLLYPVFPKETNFTLLLFLRYGHPADKQRFLLFFHNK